MDKILNYMTTIILIVGILVGSICTLIVVIDWHRQNKLIKDYMERSK
jgi:hypothetical protein